jgi:hypothetical protein
MNTTQQILLSSRRRKALEFIWSEQYQDAFREAVAYERLFLQISEEDQEEELDAGGEEIFDFLVERRFEGWSDPPIAPLEEVEVIGVPTVSEPEPPKPKKKLRIAIPDDS